MPLRFLMIVLAVSTVTASAQPSVSIHGTSDSVDGSIFRSGQFEPFVVRSDVDETTLAVSIGDPRITEMAWPAGPGFVRGGAQVDSLILRDDGAGTDVAAGDGIYTAAPVRYRYDGAFGPTAGYGFGSRRARVTYADGQIAQLTVTLPLSLGVLASDVSVVTPFRDSPEAGVDRTQHVVAVVDASRNLATLTTRLLALTPTEPDFVVIADVVASRTASGAGRFTRVKNEVEGIGLSPVDASSAYGATGTLQGVVAVFPFPNPLLLNHELGHNWLAFLDGSLGLASGTHWGAMERPSTGFGSPSWGAYPAIDAASDGTFRAALQPRDARFNDLELYLMGLIGPGEVASPIRALADPVSERFELGVEVFTASGTRDVTMNEIVAAQGTRLPAAGQAQTAFTMQAMVVSDRPLTDVEMTFFDVVMQAYERADASAYPAPLLSFESATGGRATVTTRLPFTGVSAETAPPATASLTVAGRNPVADRARFQIDLPAPGRARVVVYDVLGRRVAGVLDADLPTGLAMVTWDTGAAAPGVYTVVMTHAGDTVTARVTVVR